MAASKRGIRARECSVNTRPELLLNSDGRLRYLILVSQPRPLLLHGPILHRGHHVLQPAVPKDTTPPRIHGHLLQSLVSGRSAHRRYEAVAPLHHLPHTYLLPPDRLPHRLVDALARRQRGGVARPRDRLDCAPETAALILRHLAEELVVVQALDVLQDGLSRLCMPITVARWK